MARGGNLNLPTYGSFAQSSSGSLNKIFLRAEIPGASFLRVCTYRESARREIRVPFAATRRRMIRRGEHVQRNGSQILCAFVVSGVQCRERSIAGDMHARMLRFCAGRADEPVAEFSARGTMLLPDKRRFRPLTL